MSSNTKERLLHDLEALKHQLAEIEAYGTDREGEIPAAANIPTLETDNIPLLGDAVPADRDEAIAAHRAAMAQLDAELKELDKKDQNVPANNSVHEPAIEQKESPKIVDTTTEITADRPSRAIDSQPPYAEHSSNKAAPPQSPKPVSKAAINSALPKKPNTTTVKPAATPKTPMAPQTFSLQGLTPTMTTSKPAATSDDNPFLPAHLRERLNKSKSSLLEEIARSSESLDASTALLRNFGQGHLAAQQARPLNSEAHYQDIVDTLVAKYLPLIEADLRQRLTTALAQQVANQKNPEHSH